jgi:hypothetical protein
MTQARTSLSRARSVDKSPPKGDFLVTAQTSSFLGKHPANDNRFHGRMQLELSINNCYKNWMIFCMLMEGLKGNEGINKKKII